MLKIRLYMFLEDETHDDNGYHSVSASGNHAYWCGNCGHLLAPMDHYCSDCGYELIDLVEV